MSFFKKFSKIQIWIIGVLFFVLGTDHLKALENVENLWSVRIPISLDGTIKPIDTLRIQTSIGGRITSLEVEENEVVQKNQELLKLKNETQMEVMKVEKTANSSDNVKYGLSHGSLYGTRIEDEEISLGSTDVYNIHAVYESNDDNAAVIPKKPAPTTAILLRLPTMDISFAIMNC